jgi:hypothetical protein
MQTTLQRDNLPHSVTKGIRDDLQAQRAVSQVALDQGPVGLSVIPVDQ